MKIIYAVTQQSKKKKKFRKVKTCRNNERRNSIIQSTNDVREASVRLCSSIRNNNNMFPRIKTFLYDVYDLIKVLIFIFN